MAKTGPQKIPGASQTYFYGTGRYSGSDMEVNCGVVHTTEGRTVPTYSGGAMAPTVTGMPDIKARKIRWYQHFDVDESARALANKLGGVETNTANVFQIELVGTCDDRYAKTWGTAKAGVDYLHWPTAPDWALAELAWLVRWLYDYHKVPLIGVKNWLAYGKDSRRPGITPASYGASPARMSQAQWRAFTGWCGHQHVPENDHGDPGSLDFARVLELAKGETEEPAPTAPAQPAPSAPEESMDYTSLACSKPVIIPAGGATKLYWDAEYQDGAGDHVQGGKVILSGEHYTGTVSVSFSEDVPPCIFARMVQEAEDGSGTSGEPAHELAPGTRMHSIPVTGRVPEDRGMTFEIKNQSGEPVTLTWAGLRLLTWAL